MTIDERLREARTDYQRLVQDSSTSAPHLLASPDRKPANHRARVLAIAAVVTLVVGVAVVALIGDDGDSPDVATAPSEQAPQTNGSDVTVEESPFDGARYVGELIERRFLIGGTQPDGTLAFTARQLDGSPLTFLAAPEIAEDTKAMDIALRGWVTCSPGCGDAELTATLRLPEEMSESRRFTRADGIVVREVSIGGVTYLIFDLELWHLMATTHGIPSGELERWALDLPLSEGPTGSPVISDDLGFLLVHDASPTVELQNAEPFFFVISNGSTCAPERITPPAPPGPDNGASSYASSCPDPAFPGLNLQGDAAEVQRFYAGLRFGSVN